MKRILIILFCVSGSALLAQMDNAMKNKIDSLKKLISTASHDSVRIKNLAEWDNLIFSFDDELDLELNLKIKKICETNLTKKITKIEKHFYNQNLGKSLNNLGNVYEHRGDIAQGIGCYTRSLKIYESINDLDGMASSLNNIGNININQKDTIKALNYYEQSLSIREKINDKEGMAMTYNNISSIYHSMGDHQKAIDLSLKSLKIREELGNKRGAATSLNNLGTIYAYLGDNDKALDYYNKSLVLKIEINDKLGEALCYLNIGNSFVRKNNIEKGIEFYTKALIIGKEFRTVLTVLDASKALFEGYKSIGKYNEALEMHELYVLMKDSMERAEGKKELVRQEFKFKYEKKAAADSVRISEEKKVTAAKLQQELMQRYLLYGGLALTIVFGFFMFNRFRITRKQKNIIEEQKKIVESQKELVEAKQREVMDSIHYAKRIQESLLPSKKSIDKNISRLNKK